MTVCCNLPEKHGLPTEVKMHGSKYKAHDAIYLKRTEEIQEIIMLMRQQPPAVNYIRKS